MIILVLIGFFFLDDTPSLASSAGDGAVTAGYFTLSWSSTDRVELQESASIEFVDTETVYEGMDQATTLTGRRDGTYYFRLRTLNGRGHPSPWSQPVSVNVAHHSLSKAMAFFAVGAVVFLLSLLTVVRGSQMKRARGNE